MIQHYSDKYREAVSKLVKEFLDTKAGGRLAQIDDKILSATIGTFEGENSKNAFLLLDEDKVVGLLFGVEVPMKHNSEKVYQEILWYIQKPHGHKAKYLINEVHRRLKARGFSTVVMTIFEAINAERIEHLLDQFGYKKLETHYISTLD